MTRYQAKRNRLGNGEKAHYVSRLESGVWREDISMRWWRHAWQRGMVCGEKAAAWRSLAAGESGMASLKSVASAPDVYLSSYKAAANIFRQHGRRRRGISAPAASRSSIVIVNNIGET